MRLRECPFFKSGILLTFIVSLVIALSSCSGATKEKHITRGEEYLKKHRFNEAVMEFRAAVDIDPNSPEAHWGLARSYESLGQVNETLDELRQVTTLAPDNLDAKTKLGNYFLLFNPPLIGESEKTLAEIFAVDPNFIEGHILKASIMAANNKPEKEVVAALDQAIAIDPARVETYLSLSRYYTRQNKPADAEKAIQKAISVKENSVTAYLEYGRFLTFADRASDAEAKFKKAIEIDATDVDAREALAAYYMGERQMDKAEQAYKDLVAMQENSAESRRQLADFYALVDREDDAVKVFEEILKDAPEFAQARYRLGEIYLGKKETEKVLEQVKKLLEINDTDAQALMLSARVKMQENNAESAIKDLEEVLKKQPSLKSALYYMTQARLSLGQVDQARAFIGDLEKYHPAYYNSKLLKVQASLVANQNEMALREANELNETLKNASPGPETSAQELEELRFHAVSVHGTANLALNKLDEARADFKRVLELSPNSSNGHLNLARVELAARNHPLAMSLFEKALSIDQKNFDALTGIVGIYSIQKQYQQAHARVDKVIAEKEGQKQILPALHYLKADVFIAEKNYQAAETELAKAIEIDESYLAAYSAYAALLVEQNQIDQAIEQYKKVVQKKESSSIYTLIGMLEDTRENYGEAEQNYRKALELSPENPIAANNLAWIIAAYDKGNLDEALQLAQTTVTKNSGNPGFYDTLGWVYYKKGLFPTAVEQLKKAVALDEAEAARRGETPNPAYRVRLGMALASAGDKPNAKREAEIALKRENNLSPQDVQEAKRLLGNF